MAGVALPWKQPIRLGDVGSDVLAVKGPLARLRARGELHFRGELRNDRKAGPVFLAALKALQHKHGLKADGVYGPRTHALVAPMFRPYERWLYRVARSRKPRSPYVNPFWRSSGLVPGRTDQGVDYHGYGPICAIGDCEIIGNGGQGWPGGNYLDYRLLDGVERGHHVYVAESISGAMSAALDGHPRRLALRASIKFRTKAALGKLHPRLARVKAGAKIASFGPGAAPGNYPGIETGWGSGTLNLTLAAAMGNTGGPGHSDSPAGEAFARFLRSLGAPTAENPGPGPTYPR